MIGFLGEWVQETNEDKKLYYLCQKKMALNEVGCSRKTCLVGCQVSKKRFYSKLSGELEQKSLLFLSPLKLRDNSVLYVCDGECIRHNHLQ